MSEIQPSKYTRWRTFVRFGFIVALLATPLRILGFDHRTGHFFFFQWGIPLAKLYIPFLLFLVVFIGLLLLSMLRGRIFCSWFCPMHTYLEGTNRTEKPNKLKRLILGLLLAIFGMEVVISFFLPIPDQIHILSSSKMSLSSDPRGISFEESIDSPSTRAESYRSGIQTSPRWPLLAGAMATLTTLFFLLLTLYRERFCQQACPYALVQLLLQNENTHAMQFKDPERNCIHCNRCDIACPQNLKARMECSQRHCTNCYSCAEACQLALGQGKGLFALEGNQEKQDPKHDEQ